MREALGPLEPPMHDAWLWVVGRVERLRRAAVVVVATDGGHLDRVADTAARPVDRRGRIGVWITCADDVAPFGDHDWFVVRLDPDPAGPGPGDGPRGSTVDAGVAATVAAWRRACRRVEVVDLRGDPSRG